MTTADHTRSIETIVNLARAAARLCLLLDYDGTLVPIADRPELAVPDADLISLLRALAARAATTVHIVSGRPRDTLDGWFGALPIGMWAEHGAFCRPVGAGAWHAMRPMPEGWEQEILPILERFTAETPGAFIERKTSTLAWHYRLADPVHGVRQSHAVQAALSAADTREPIDVLRGKKVVEARLEGVSKRLAAQAVHRADGAGLLTLAIGDDETDDELFVALPPGSVTVAVGRRTCAAQYRVADVGQVRSLLSGLLS